MSDRVLSTNTHQWRNNSTILLLAIYQHSFIIWYAAKKNSHSQCDIVTVPLFLEKFKSDQYISWQKHTCVKQILCGMGIHIHHFLWKLMSSAVSYDCHFIRSSHDNIKNRKDDSCNLQHVKTSTVLYNLVQAYVF